MTKRKYEEIDQLSEPIELVKMLKSQISYLNSDIALFLRKVRENQSQIAKIEKYLYELCDHEWERDYTIMSEHSEYQCEKCGCYK